MFVFLNDNEKYSTTRVFRYCKKKCLFWYWIVNYFYAKTNDFSWEINLKSETIFANEAVMWMPFPLFSEVQKKDTIFVTHIKIFVDKNIFL